MKKNLRKYRRKILENIRTEYESCKDLIEQEPSKIKKVSVKLIIVSTLLFIIEIIGLVIPSKLIVIVFVVVLLIFIALGMWYYQLEREYKEFRKNKSSSIRQVCDMVLEDEAKKYSLSKEELTIYLFANYETPKYLRTFTFIISAAATSYAVYALPGYDQVNHGLVIFVALVFANIFLSVSVSFVSKIIEGIDQFDFYIKKPYQELFESIDQKLTEMNEKEN